MPFAMSAHVTLRSATASSHEAVDAAFGRFDLTIATEYAGFLAAHARALPAVEAALAGIEGLPPMRPRTALLHEDLAAMGVAVPDPLPFVPPEDKAAAFCAAYVIEGSRLGGGMLARRVPAALPHAYLSAIHESGEWRAFGQAMDAAAADEHWIDRAIASAKRVFALYAEAAR